MNTMKISFLSSKFGQEAFSEENQNVLTKIKILVHIPMLLYPVHCGITKKHNGFLKYLFSRKDVLSVDAFSSNYYHYPRWNSRQREEILKYVDNFYVYECENNKFDHAYRRIKSIYSEAILRQQLPVGSDQLTPPGYVSFVQELMRRKKYDFLWIHDLEFANLASKSLKFSPKKVLDVIDLTSRKRMVPKDDHQSKLRFEFESNFKREINLMNKFDDVIITSREEFGMVIPYISSSKLNLIPYVIEELRPRTQIPPYKSRNFVYDLLFVGTDYPPNIEGIKFFLSYIFPGILQQRPNTRLAIVGKVSSFVQIDSNLLENITCLGFVQNLADIYLTSRLLICPLLSGSGTKIKLQEAMSLGLPVISTSVGVSGMQFEDGLNAFIADDPSLFIQKTLNLLVEPGLAQKFSEKTSRVFESEYSISVAYSKLDKLLGICS
jgi:glycosyltransferase involved in cell wall biosynthesis